MSRSDLNGGIPPIKCRATNRNGAMCGKYAVPGATVCRLHGGNAPQVRRKAAERVVLAQLDPDENISPLDALLDANRRMVAVVRQATTQLEAGDEVTSDQLHRLAELLKAQAHIGKTCLDAGVELKIAESLDVTSKVLADALDAALGCLDPLGLDYPTRRAVEDDARERAVRALSQGETGAGAGLSQRAPVVVGELVVAPSHDGLGHVPMP